MPTISDSLLSLGEKRLQQIIGENVLSVISDMNMSLKPSSLVDLVISIYQNELLMNEEIIGEVVHSLRREDAEKLENLILGTCSDDPWKMLAGVNFKKGSTNLKKIYNFFNVEYPVYKAIERQSIETVEPLYSLHDYQIDIQRRINMYVDGARGGRCVVHMPTGSGKTRTAIRLLSEILNSKGGVIVWLAHTEELCGQAAEEFVRCWQYLGNRTVEIGRFYGEYELPIADFKTGFIVASLQKLYSRSGSDTASFYSLKRNLSIVVIDEAHKAIARTYKHLLEMLCPNHGAVSLIGLTATPGRSWTDYEQDRELARFFSDNKVTLSVDGYANPVQYLIESGFLAKPSFHQTEHDGKVLLSQKEVKALEDGFDIGEEFLEKISLDHARNIKVMNLVLDAVRNPSNKIIVFACTILHAEIITALLCINGVKAACLTSSSGSEARSHMLDQYKSRDGGIQVIVNCQILTTGFDAPVTNVCIIARPTRSVSLYSQMVGRALRGPLSGGNQNADIFTVVDTNLKGFRGIYDGFFHWEDAWGVKND